MTTLADAGQGVDVAIDGLGFRLAIGAETPYERATAQFRKDQLDSAQNVGDQSLTGWWTRGQLSFHKGAGVKYYEVLDGESVLERYTDSNALYVSDPGRAYLMPALSDMGIAAIDAVPAPLSAGGGVYVLTSTGVKFTAGSGSVNVATSDAGIPTSITSSGPLYYVANGDTIEKQFDAASDRTNHLVNPSFETNTTSWSGTGTNLSQTNYVTNPSFETGATGWTAAGSAVRTNLLTNPSFETTATGWAAGGGATTPASTTVLGDKVARFDIRPVGSGPGRVTFWQSAGIESPRVTATANTSYALRCRIRAQSTNTHNNEMGSRLIFSWQKSDNTPISDSIIDLDPPALGDWSDRSFVATAPPLTGKVQVAVQVTRSPDKGGLWEDNRYYVDQVMLEQAETVGSYFDGSTTDTATITYAWTGATDASTSTATYASTAAQSAVQAKVGTKSLKVANEVPTGLSAASYTVSGLSIAAAYKVLAWVYREAQDTTVELKMGSTVLDTTSAAVGAWELLEGTYTATATSHVLSFNQTGSGDSGAYYVDAVLVTQSPWTGGYFDGDTADGSVTYAWTGTVNGSTSTATDTSTTMLTSVTTRAKYGTRSMQVWDEHLRTTPLTAQITLTGLTIAQDYQLSAWVYVTTQPGRTVSMSVDALSVLDTSTTQNAWERLTGTFTATGTSHTLKLAHTGAGATSHFYIDSVMWVEAPYFSDYFDGSLPGASWTGTPHASKSTYTGAGSTSSTALWVNSSNDWTKVWWAKGRLWAVDTDGYWYALAPNGGTVDTTDAFWNSGQPAAPWALAEGTGPVYISDGFDIYTVTVDTDGIVPTLETPTTAARMPLGEQIATISYYLGYVIIASTRGVRIAATQDNDVLLGPLVIRGDFSQANRIGAFDTRVFIVGRPELRGGATVLCYVNVGEFVSDLLPAWAPVVTISELASSQSGALVDSTGRLYAWGSATLYVSSPDDVSATGYLTTGFHRFGTLEPKWFQSVLVRTAGAGGTVDVARVDADGTVTDLSTITVPATGVQNVDLAMTTSAEMVGLKFTLNRSSADSTIGPELLGYQLRALPAPTRQRMIRLPVMLEDIERRGGSPASGYTGSAWDRLSTLETHETNGSVVSYQDFRTGETAEVYIETIEHRGITPPGPGNNGFGGLVFLTLRKL